MLPSVGLQRVMTEWLNNNKSGRFQQDKRIHEIKTSEFGRLTRTGCTIVTCSYNGFLRRREKKK